MRTSVRRSGHGLLFGLGILPATALAAPVTVWLAGELPEARHLDKADRQTGGTAQLDGDDLRFPPAPLSAVDDARVEAVRTALRASKERWDDFDVELAIARDLQAAVGAVDLLRDDRDRFDVVQALIFQGASAVRAFDPATFGTEETAAPFRVDVGGAVVPRPWLDALALLGTGTIAREELPDGTAWGDYQRFAEVLEKLPAASLGLDPDAGAVWIDGAPTPAGAAKIELRPGRHYLHVVRGGVVSGRQVVDLAPGEARSMPAAVSEADLEAAAARVMMGSKAGLPEAVVAALDGVDAHHGGPTFVGAVDGSRSMVVPWSEKAVLVDSRLVTVVLSGEIGGGVLLSPVFDQGEGSDLELAPALSAGLGLELGISYFALAGGIDAAITPGHTITHANLDSSANRDTSVMPQPWGGLGAYALRPTGRKPTLAILGTVAWNAPAHIGYGGRIVIGVPVDNRVTWFRIALGGSYGMATGGWADVEDVDPLIGGYLRVGLGSRL